MLITEDSRPVNDILRGFSAEFSAAKSCASVRDDSDEELVERAIQVEQAGRLLDAHRVAVAAEIAERSRKSLEVAERLSSKRGCRSATELLERLTGVSAKTIAKRLRLGDQVRTQYSLDGMAFPAKFPAVAAGLASGLLGRDSAEAIITALGPLLARPNRLPRCRAHQRLFGQLQLGHLDPAMQRPQCGDAIQVPCGFGQQLPQGQHRGL